MRNPIILSLLSILLMGNCMAQAYYQVDAQHPLNGNPYYILPKATLVIKVPVTTIAYKRGSEYTPGCSDDELKILAKKYGVDPNIYKKLAATDSYQESSLNEDSLSISIAAKPDYTKVFYTEGEKNWNKNKSVTFTYGADGTVTDGVSSTENKTFDIVVKSLSSIVSIASAAFRGPLETHMKDPDLTYPDLDKILEDIATLGTSMINNDIYKDVKSNLEKKYTKSFSQYFYAVTKKDKSIKVYYTPAQQPADNQPFDLFSLNAANGRVTFNQSLQNELWGSDLITGTLTSTEAYKLRLTGQPESFQASVNIQQMPSDGFAYNIPKRLEVKLTNPKAETMYDDFCKFPQFGIIGRLYTSKNALSFSLDPITGELKKLTVSSSAITTDQVGAVASAGSDAIKLARGDSADTKLDNEVKRLDNEVKKRDLLKQLAEAQQ